MPKAIIVSMAALLGVACQHASSGEGLAEMPAPQAQAEKGGLAFIQAACGGCHAVEAGYLSPNPQAPRWEDLANREGLSEETLSSWLYDAHNYPEIMDFDLNPARARMIANYILQMQSEDYRPLPE